MLETRTSPGAQTNRILLLRKTEPTTNHGLKSQERQTEIWFVWFICTLSLTKSPTSYICIKVHCSVCCLSPAAGDLNRPQLALFGFVKLQKYIDSFAAPVLSATITERWNKSNDWQLLNFSITLLYKWHLHSSKFVVSRVDLVSSVP